MAAARFRCSSVAAGREGRARGFARLACAAVALALAPGIAEAALRLVAAELPPYTYQVPPPTVAEIPGPGQGVVHEVVEELARRVGQPPVIEYLSWPEAQRLAQARDDVAILALTRTPEREAQYRWIARIVTDDLVLAARRGPSAPTLAALRERPVGVLRGSGAQALLREQRFTRVAAAPEEWVNATWLRDGRIDGWLAPRMMIHHAWREVGGDPRALAIVEVVRPSEIWFAAGARVPDAEVVRWQRAFESMQADGSLARIVAKYENLDVRPIPDDLRREMSGPLWTFPF